MADWRVRGMAIAVAAGFTAVACGSRTGDYLGTSGEDIGFGPGGASGAGGSGGFSTFGDVQSAPSAVTTHGFTAVTGSGGGVASTGDSCVPGVCQCSDCMSACLCNGLGMSRCEDRCAQQQVVSGSGFGTGFSASSFVSGAGGFIGVTGVTTSAFSVVSGTSGISTSTTGVTTSGVGGAPGDCCERSAGPGCEDPDVAACVCEVDPFCCAYMWDSFCVGEVQGLGCGTCEAGTGGAGGSTQSVVTGVGGAPAAVTVTVTSTGQGGAPSTTSTTGDGGAGGVAECIAQSQSNCEACLCGDCFQSYGDCVGDFGCPKILECMDATGCTGLDCYTPEACQNVIDRFGGPAGSSLAYVTELVECAVGASCPCQ